MQDAIRADNLGLHIGAFGLRNLSIAVPEGKITSIIGPNGSGKSTLLKLLTRLLTPDEGTVAIGGQPLASYKSGELARTVAMLTQSKGAMPELTVKELVAYGRSPHQRPFARRFTPDDNQIVDWALTVTGTKAAEDRMFHTLSGGEQQKARIAMALAQKTNILLLDEPTTFLDIAHQLDLMEMIQELNSKHGLTVLMVLHDLQQAAKYSDHLIALKRGRLAAMGPPSEVLSSRFLREVYEIEAKIIKDDGYPLIIPVKTIKKTEESQMVIVTNTSQITPGNAHKLIERFDKVGKVETMQGFLGLEVLQTQNTSDFDEVSVVTRWSTKEDFQAWTRSSAFKESHAHRQIPDYILSNKITFQEVKIIRNPIVSEELAAEAETL